MISDGRVPPAGGPASARRRRALDQRGATLVEAALVTPAFFVLIFAIIELGLLAHHDLATTNASRVGARAAGVFDRQNDADYQILQAVRGGVEAVGPNEVDYVVVYRIPAVGDDMNPNCHTRSVPSSEDPLRPCNRYTSAELGLEFYRADGVTPTGDFGCTPTSVDRHWCPTDRETSLSGGLDLVGVHVRTEHRFLTGLFGATRALSEETVTQVEPDGQ